MWCELTADFQRAYGEGIEKRWYLGRSKARRLL